MDELFECYLCRMEQPYAIDPERMNRVLRQLRLNVRWEELLERYVNYRPRYAPELFAYMTLDQLMAFSTVFHFTKTTIVQLRRELSGFVRNFPELYGDTLHEVLTKMHYTLNVYNNMNRFRVPYVNWLPQFGGVLQQFYGNPQIAYMQQHGIPLWMTGVIPQ